MKSNMDIQKNKLQDDQNTPLLGIYTRSKSVMPKRDLHAYISWTTINNSQIRKEPQSPLTDE